MLIWRASGRCWLDQTSRKVRVHPSCSHSASLADDLGDYAHAASFLREANRLIDHRSWSRKTWRRMIDP